MELKMSRIAHLFAVPLTLVSTDDSTINGKSDSNKTNGVEDKDKVSAATIEDKKNGETKLNGEVHNGTTKRKKNKKKQQSRPAPVRTYIDYDKNLEDNQPSLWTWQGAAHGNGGGGQEMAPSTSVFSPSMQREVVSYQELSQPQPFSGNWHAQHRNGHQLQNGPPGIQSKCHLPGQNPNSFPSQQNKQNSNSLNKSPFLKRKANQHQHPNKIARMNPAVNKTNGNNVHGNNVNGNAPSLPMALANNFIDPIVAATEQKELFQKPQPIIDNNGRKPLSSKQRKKIKKAKFYKEKMRLQAEKEKEKIAALKQLPCRYFSHGSCNKGAECPYSHEFVPQKKPELCKFYVISFCEKGSSCLYYHNDWPCKFFHAYRSCSQGDRCRFSHRPLTDETRPLLEKLLNENNHPGVPVAGMVTHPESQRIADARAQGPFSFFGTSNAHLHPGAPFLMSPHHGFHQPWNAKLEPIDVDDSYWSYIPSDPSGNDPRIKERLLRKDDPVSYVAPHKRVPLVPLECPRVICFSLNVPDSPSLHVGDRVSVDCDHRGVAVTDDPGFASNPAVTEERTQESELPSSDLLSARDGVPDEVKTARHLSLPIMQVVARGSANKFTRLKRGNEVSAPNSPNMSSALS